MMHPIKKKKILSIQTVQAQPMVVQEQKLNNGEIVQMCVFDTGSYGYCTSEDEYKAVNAYQNSKHQTKIQKFNTGVNNTVNTIISARRCKSHWKLFIGIWE